MAFNMSVVCKEIITYSFLFSFLLQAPENKSNGRVWLEPPTWKKERTKRKKEHLFLHYYSRISNWTNVLSGFDQQLILIYTTRVYIDHKS